MSELNRWSTSAAGALQNASGYFPEGQAPSTVNDAARTIMAEVRRWQQSRSPEKTATYAAQAYAVTYDREVTAGELGGIYAFIAELANSASATLNINGLGAKDIVKPSGHLQQSDIDAQQVCVVAYSVANQNFELISRTKNESAAGFRLQTAAAANSGSSVTFSTLPTWVKRITWEFAAVSSDGGNNLLIQVGDVSGGMKTSGYVGAASLFADGAATAIDNPTTGFGIKIGAAAAVVHGSVTLTLLNPATYTWLASGVLARSDAARSITVAGYVVLPGVLDRTRIVTSGGDSLDGLGVVNIILEG